MREAGSDPVMHQVQDEFFDRVYWAPSASDAASMGLTSALGTNVVYDSHVHGSWPRISKRTTNQRGTVGELGEKKWISAYVAERKAWLAASSNPLLQKTVYRMEAFEKLISDKKWTLPLPLTVRGVVISKALLSAEAPVRVSAHDAEERTLRLQSPLMQGDDVKAVQQALVRAGFAVTPDGAFGSITDAAVKLFQKQKGLTIDGIVGPATRSALGL